MKNNKSSVLCVVGSQWGDEGKGKVTDYFAQNSDVIVRAQGGNNAGHTINFNGKKFALRSIPSGVFNTKAISIMANGMVIDPKQFLEELDMLNANGITNINLKISNRAHIVMPYHKDLDEAYEKLKDNPVGTTKKGIGPAYADKANRIGIRMGEFINPEIFKESLKNTLKIKNFELRNLGYKEYDLDTLFDEYKEYAKRIKPFVTDTSLLINDEYDKGKKILFEGAQGAMLCLDHGTYPYVTSSSPTASAIPLNAGISPLYIDNIIGVCKAYSTRVGDGAFPTELNNETGNLIREKGHEYGTVTKRPRRVGYLDLVALNYAVRVSGINYLAVMLLDVLSGFDTLKVCKAYELDGKIINTIPSTINEFERCIPIYEELEGFNEDISKIKNYDNLPLNAKKYIEKIEEITETKVALISVGPDRSQTIERIKLI